MVLVAQTPLHLRLDNDIPRDYDSIQSISFSSSSSFCPNAKDIPPSALLSSLSAGPSLSSSQSSSSSSASSPSSCYADSSFSYPCSSSSSDTSNNRLRWFLVVLCLCLAWKLFPQSPKSDSRGMLRKNRNQRTEMSRVRVSFAVVAHSCMMVRSSSVNAFGFNPDGQDVWQSVVEDSVLADYASPDTSSCLIQHAINRDALEGAQLLAVEELTPPTVNSFPSVEDPECHQYSRPCEYVPLACVMEASRLFDHTASTSSNGLFLFLSPNEPTSTREHVASAPRSPPPPSPMSMSMATRTCIAEAFGDASFLQTQGEHTDRQAESILVVDVRDQSPAAPQRPKRFGRSSSSPMRICTRSRTQTSDQPEPKMEYKPKKKRSRKARPKRSRAVKPCSMPNCTTIARSRGLCKRHGGGRRCSFPECTLSDQGGGLCIRHGGGKRCSVQDCPNSAQSGGKCKSHGGGAMCSRSGCTRRCQRAGLCRPHLNESN